MRHFLIDEAGVAAIEFALVILPFLLFVFGIFEFGRAFYIRSNLEDVANQTIRQIYIAEISPSDTLASLGRSMTSYARSVMTAGDPMLLSVSVAAGPGAQSRTMTITYDFEFLVNLIGQSSITLETSRAFVAS